jgi:hypothetical protein
MEQIRAQPAAAGTALVPVWMVERGSTAPPAS